MRVTNFCMTCGASLMQRGWRQWLRGPVCPDCSRRGGSARRMRALILIASLVLVAFGLGRSMRAPPPPLMVQRSANSPLSDLPINLGEITKGNSARSDGANTTAPDETVYLCGARTKKGTPCKRRVHVLGDRCYQHKGMPAMVPLEKLVIKPDTPNQR
jgi:hypothetical protein